MFSIRTASVIVHKFEHKMLCITLVLLAIPHYLLAQGKQDEGPYPVDKASVRQSNVPQGKLIKRTFANSKVFPGTEREFAIYVPSQYDGTKEACLMVIQDGMRLASEKGASKIPIVFDNLIHSGEMPLTIGVFINPGVVPAKNENALPRFNRSFEYDAIDTRYVDFLINEILPEVTKDYKISSDPNSRGICGSSSGGIAAFNVAWQRPDQFRRVYTMVGTYIGLRGANEISVLVRKTAPKPLRVFLQDGSNDLNIYCGDWWVANQGMLSALKFSGYEVEHVWGEGYHGQKHGGAIFPDAMRYIWKDFPQPVKTHFENSKSRATEMLLPDSEWELVPAQSEASHWALAGDAGGMAWADSESGTVFRRTANGEQTTVWDVSAWGANKRFGAPHIKPFFGGIAIGPDDKVYACLPFQNSVVRFGDNPLKFDTIASNVKATDLVVAHDGTVYFTDSQAKSVWMVAPGGEAKLAGDGFSGATGIALSPDQSLVYVADPDGRYVWSAVRKGDGTLTHIQPYFHIHSPPASVDVRPHSNGICVDQAGWVLVASKMGIQICDQPGRVNLIIPPPQGSGAAGNICLGGKNGQTLYATFGNKIYQMKTRLTASFEGQQPTKPRKPRL